MTEDRPNFLAAAKALTPKRELELPELGITIQVRGLTAREINTITKQCTKKNPKGRKGIGDLDDLDTDLMTCKMLTVCCSYLDGTPLVDASHELEWLDLPQHLIQRLSAVVQDLNAPLSKDAEGNSEGTTADDSSSV